VLWVVVFVVLGGLALAGAVAYGFWLAHRFADLTTEVGVLARQAGQLAELVGQLQLPAEAIGPDRDPVLLEDEDAEYSGPRTIADNVARRPAT
jgi:hypothetical protein